YNILLSGIRTSRRQVVRQLLLILSGNLKEECSRFFHLSSFVVPIYKRFEENIVSIVFKRELVHNQIYNFLGLFFFSFLQQSLYQTRHIASVRNAVFTRFRIVVYIGRSRITPI